MRVRFLDNEIRSMPEQCFGPPRGQPNKVVDYKIRMPITVSGLLFGGPTSPSPSPVGKKASDKIMVPVARHWTGSSQWQDRRHCCFQAYLQAGMSTHGWLISQCPYCNPALDDGNEETRRECKSYHRKNMVWAVRVTLVSGGKVPATAYQACAKVEIRMSE